jgi:predicted DNA-binding protein
MDYTNTSIHLPDRTLLQRIHAAATSVGKKPSSFMRDAIEREVVRVEKRHPTKRAKRSTSPKKRAA